MFSITHCISPAELSPGAQHLHHAQAICLLEKARLAYLESIGCSNQSLIQQDIFLVIASLNARYSREIFAESVQITCESPQILSRIVRVEQRILRADGAECVRAQVDSLCMQGSTRRAVRLPAFLQQRFCDASKE